MRPHGTGRVLDAESSKEGVESVEINLEQRGTTMGKLFSARKRRTERGTTPLVQRPSRHKGGFCRKGDMMSKERRETSSGSVEE